MNEGLASSCNWSRSPSEAFLLFLIAPLVHGKGLPVFQSLLATGDLSLQPCCTTTTNGMKESFKF